MPTTGDSKIFKGSGTGSYSVTQTGLTENADYHVRPYAERMEQPITGK